MSDYTFLTVEQISGNQQLDILKKQGTQCSVTDFSILLGVHISATYHSIGSVGPWWTKSMTEESYRSNDDAKVVGGNGEIGWNPINSRICGSRPAIRYSLITPDRMRWNNEILEAEYGEYPQTVVSKALSTILEEEYQNKKLKKTGKTYTTDSVYSNDKDIPFIARQHIEYEYKGKKYIRIVADSFCSGKTLSDDTNIEKGKPYWIEVEPITWLIDHKNDVALSKKIIFSGIHFNKERNYFGDFKNMVIKKYMDEYFSKDIIPSKPLTQEEIKKIEQQNPYEIKYDEVTEEDIIRGAIESGIAVFLHGKSSDGKSARVKQIDPDCVIIYLRNASPESLNGKSVYNGETGEMIDVKPTWLKKLEAKCEAEPDKIHIVFFDEITNALPSIQGIAFNIVLDREVNGIWKLPENSRIVAAGNDMQDSLAANELAAPLFNRFAHVYIKTTPESWLKWASTHNIHPLIYAYIAYTGGEALRTEYNGETPNADPRKWEMASKMLYQTKKPEMLRALIGEELTRDFIEFCRQPVITIEEVLTGTYDNEQVRYLSTSKKYTTTVGLTSVTEEQVETVREFIKMIGREFLAIFDDLWARNDERKLEIIAELKLSEDNKHK